MSNAKSQSRTIWFISLLTFVATATWAQPAIDLPKASPSASISQSFGYNKVTVTYGRPGVKGRKIWGGLVPYGQVWRAGANEATTIEFSADVKINGQALPKGVYGLFVLPTEKDWTFIFSKTAKTWGAFAYDEKADALRVKVSPKRRDLLERMEVGFHTLTDSSTTLVLGWEKLSGEITLVTEFMETAKANIVAGLPKAKADDPYAWLGAASFYYAYNIDKKQSMEWVDKSIQVKPMFNNLWTKAEWLAADKNFAEARKTALLAQAEAAKDPNAAYLQKIISKGMAKWPKK